jgi:sulfatase maturation enzyme AslB (radical SAM superfamily)
MAWSGLTAPRYFRMDTINLCNLRCKMCYYSFDYKGKRTMDIPLFRKIAGESFENSVPLFELRYEGH